MSEPLPPRRNPITERRADAPPAYVGLEWYTWFEGVDRFIGTPPEAGSTGTAANYDVGTSGGRVPVLAGGTATQPNTWSGHNVYTLHVTSQAGFKVQGTQVVGPQEAAVADAGTASTIGAAPTQADFNALVGDFNDAVGVVNDILAALRAHGLIAT